MNIIFLQESLTQREHEILSREFPQYRFVSGNEKDLTPEQWQCVEVIYGQRLNPGELEMATQLRWIHSPSHFFDELCLEEVEKQQIAKVLNIAKDLQEAAKLLGIDPATLWRKRKRYQL